MAYTYSIYKICCKDVDVTDFYIGSSKNIVTRKSKHKMACNNETDKGHNLKIYQTIRANKGWDNWGIVIIEILPNITKLEAFKREEELRLQLQASLNMVSAYSGLTSKEYQKEYRKNNKEKKLIHDKTYRANNKEKKRILNKEYQENNRDVINEKRIQKQKQKVVCECGSAYSCANKSRHLKTSKHQNFHDVLYLCE